MVFDNVKNISLYEGLGDNFKKATDFIKNTDLKSLENGTVEIDGKKVFAKVMDVKLNEACYNNWEAHKKYADIQIIIDGGERIFYAYNNNCRISKEYNEEKDALFYEANPSLELCLTSGDFAIFFPDDLHMPSIVHPSIGFSRKVVVKVLL